MTDDLLSAGNKAPDNSGGDNKPDDTKNLLDTGDNTDKSPQKKVDKDPDSPESTSSSPDPEKPDKSLLPGALKAAGLDESDIGEYMSLMELKDKEGKILGKYDSITKVIEALKNSSTEIRKIKEGSNAPDSYSEEALNGVEFSDDQKAKFKEARVKITL